MATLFQGKDHALIYSQIRQPTPASVINRVLEFLTEKYSGKLALAVDVGCGSGQNTFLFADKFEKVVGIDISAAQIEAATSKNERTNVNFEVHNSHEIPAKDESVQLITASAAAHWFDLPKFFDEGHRVLCQDGVMALYSYNMFPRLTFVNGTDDFDKKSSQVNDIVDKSSQVNDIVDKLYYETLWEHWDREKVKLVMDLYKDVTIPMRDLTREYDFLNHYTMTLQDVSARIQSSSGFQSYCTLIGKDRGDAVIQTFENDVYRILGEAFKDVPQEEIRFNAEDNLFLVMARK
ncbi:unnamed protein product [Allacma fusca]|uniref:Methyltransferase type 11 domain-containing protein n=2 Tax=Allacma fusca TaxID=39272 RepID=A0A8J2PJX6_9HEXA|nr:unnamed protein product [Allacma fusca]